VEVNVMSYARICLAFALLTGALPAQAVSISLLPSSTSLQSGETVLISIVASDFGEDEFASAYDFSIGFDPALLGYIDDSFVVGAALGTVPDVDFFDFTDPSGADSGSLLPFVTSLLEDSELAALQTGGDVTLATFELRALDTLVEQLTGVSLTCNSVSGPFDAEGIAVLLDIDGCSGVELSIAPRSAVPEPSGLVWLAGALVWLGARRRAQG
jgi:hypothetical protein